jgi:hypothetical protein
VLSLPEGEAAVFADGGTRIAAASEGAWRYIGWLVTDSRTKQVTRYPAELFGPLPPLRREEIAGAS